MLLAIRVAIPSLAYRCSEDSSGFQWIQWIPLDSKWESKNPKSHGIHGIPMFHWIPLDSKVDSRIPLDSKMDSS
jgi:hypothetical protein